ncbi:Alpha/Beta hydrolase protein [Massariosphaeria phaeospora]|uniref:Alpha/Beta hydrolase protein n=1 Tax=Massariosphaeria phaeospora TaxID=100035 RepID=A0A7C8MI50_9PLEO|nr:Alpha/Beta hydrolase protein [Massariosphaeria phaeospora]
MSFLTEHPGKAVWVLGAVLVTLAQLPLLSVYYILKRPNPKWTVRQALMNHLMRGFLYHTAVVKVKTPLRLDPGSEGERFVEMPPVEDVHVRGILDDETIRPVSTGGTWYPAPPPKDCKSKVILHVHGGGYAIGEGRAADAAYAGRTLTENTAPYALFVQYRLASNNEGRFPGALQDALSAYAYLLGQGHKASNIVISGDSAGGHIALSLLRYLSTENVDLPPPRALLLWSAAIDLEAAKDPSTINRSAYYDTDYLVGNFVSWGATKFSEGLDLSDSTLRAYVKQLGYGFRAVSPIWMCAGSLEIFEPESLRMGEELQQMGSVVQTHTIPNAPHDVLFVGNILGFEREAVEAAKLAHRFIEEVA